MWQKGHLHAQSCFLWSMTCISVKKKTLFSPKVKQDPTHRTATWVKSLRSIFSLCAADVFIIWGAGSGCPSSLQWCLKREVWGGPSCRLDPTDPQLGVYLRGPRGCLLSRRAAKLSTGKPAQDIAFIFINFSRWFNGFFPGSHRRGARCLSPLKISFFRHVWSSFHRRGFVGRRPCMWRGENIITTKSNV